jgi:pimeloyl-ACP methyl ester carboxylesterase
LFAAVLSEVASEQGVRLITPDRPGYGDSSPPPRNWTWRDWQTDLTEVLDAEAIDRAALLGFSGGGPFALAAATSEWASRVGVIGTVIPPADTALGKLSRIPFATRVVFRLSNVLASVAGPKTVVKQYTDRPVSPTVSQAPERVAHSQPIQSNRDNPPLPFGPGTALRTKRRRYLPCGRSSPRLRED